MKRIIVLTILFYLGLVGLTLMPSHAQARPACLPCVPKPIPQLTLR